MLHIYCGDGKGKTTASLGLALRAAGAGMRVHIVQFMKGGETSELDALRLIPRISVSRCDREYPFTCDMSDVDREELTACHNGLLDEAFSCGADMVVLDEFCCAYSCGLLDTSTAETMILKASDGCDVVLTGRAPAEIFVAAADYVSDIACVKHPYENGVAARKGIEF